ENDTVSANSVYRLGSKIGEGSRARVYLASDSSQDGKKVAIKFLKDELFPESQNATDNLNYEAQILTLSAHPNVLAKLNVETNEQGQSYLITEYLSGQTLKQKFSAGAVDALSVMNLFVQLTHPIENMHKVGVLHLDLRPDKIIVDDLKKNPNPKIIGLGRAKFLPWAGREQVVEPPPKADLYSLQYTSPEQLNDKRCLPTSDVYALGCILYEALAGRPPYVGENELHVMAQHLSGKALPPSQVKGDANLKKYDDVVMQALANETHRRFVDAAEFRQALQDSLPPAPSGWMAKLFKK
ncbi:MAG: serine/threonine protein kinase, partial [Candidatus Obscuribacterales bacterium]|nr:serine/threonine protein kinase [Candidatus Obscuribacterales bacterium]